MPEELPAAGEIADGQQVREAAVDGCRRLGEVDGPDAAGIVPVEHAQGFTMALTPDGAVAADQVGEFSAGHREEVLAERRHAEVRTDFVEQMNDFVAKVTR